MSENDDRQLADKIKGFFKGMLFDNILGNKFKEEFNEELPIDFKTIDIILYNLKKNGITNYTNDEMLTKMFLKTFGKKEYENCVMIAKEKYDKDMSAINKLFEDIMKTLMIVEIHRKKMDTYLAELDKLNEEARKTTMGIEKYTEKIKELKVKFNIKNR